MKKKKDNVAHEMELANEIRSGDCESETNAEFAENAEGAERKGVKDLVLG